MLENFKYFQIKNLKIIHGGNHANSQGIPADNLKKSTDSIITLQDHGDNLGVPPK
ncbi:hypothetical protein [Aquimarina algicola]|uniref:hypothetical protein n=1 Tax=Aquimarina algicola TaxID=2589995 RepID=UPI001CF4F493|nr:hypothetical protein [Aquimarina algicola]